MRSKLSYALCCALPVLASPSAQASSLPEAYFKLMEAEVKALPRDKLEPNLGVMFSAAILYSKAHPANHLLGDKSLLDLALRIGDLHAARCAKDTEENKQDNEWEIHFWLDTYRLLEKELGTERQALWKREIEKIAQWFAGQVAYRIEFPRFQSPYIRTSTNHLALFSSTTYLAGLALHNKEWEHLGARALHRLAAEEQTPDGYWGEHTDNGPATGYNYLTMACVALYFEHSGDKAALEALRRAANFHVNFTWPDGTPVETINGRNRYWAVSPWGQFGFSHWPDGRRYAEFLTQIISTRRLSSRDLGRMAQNCLYFHEGPTSPIPQDVSNSAYRMGVQAGIRKSGPWTVCISGLVDTPIESQFTLDRQGNLSIYHQKLGLILTGANSKNQPQLATFAEKSQGHTVTIPLSARLRMQDDRDRLGLGFNTFFAELTIPKPDDKKVSAHFAITETGRGRLQDAQCNLQLCLKQGEALETAKTKIKLEEKPIVLGPEELGGIIRHHGWTMRVDPTARLVWPVMPFNPYANGPEKKLSNAVGALTVPVRVQPPAEGAALNWRRGAIEFTLEAD